MIEENAHMQKRASRKSGRGGRALLTALTRCGRCGRMMRVFYGMRSGHAHRYQGRGDDMHVSVGICIGIGGIRVDRAVAELLLEAVSSHAVDAAIKAVELASQEDEGVKLAVQRELEQARYEASRFEAVDPAKRLVARELETRWNNALEQVQPIEGRLAELAVASASRPRIDRDALMALAHDLPKAQWGWGGITTQDMHRSQVTARAVALVYNWWSWYVRAANPQARREALTSRPLLLAAVGRATSSGNQTTLYLTPMHAEAGLIKSMIANVHAAIQHVKAAAEQLPRIDRWVTLLAYICQRIVGQIGLPTPPPTLAAPG